jgi:serine protease AprX
MIRTTTTIAAALLAAVSIHTANAAPTFDPQLQKYLRAESNETIRVVVLFNNKMPMESIRSHTSANRAQVERAMIQNAMQSQAATVASLNNLRTEGKIKAARLWLINGLLLEIPASALKILERSTEARHVAADFKVGLITPVQGQYARPNREAAFTYGLQKLQIPELHQQFANITGKSVRVGIVDTGIDGTHPELKGRVVAFKDFVNGQNTAYDDNKHGTHVAGTIGGSGVGGTAIGVAPEVQYIGAKFLDKNGSGTFANAVAAMQWIADPDNNPNTDDGPAIVSNSWGGGAPSATEDPAQNALCMATDGWLKLGIVPVFAAGNSGPNARTIGLPGGCPKVVTVGATDDKDVVASFSSRGPAVWKTGSFVKPDLSAPGVKILSSIPGGQYAEFSGTSMATPHVAGMMALVYQAHPKLEVEKAVQIVKAAVDKVSGDGNTVGVGRINALKTIKSMSR